MTNRETMSWICDYFGPPSAPSTQDARPSGKQTADSKQRRSRFKHQSPPLRKRCSRSPSCHLQLVRAFIKTSAAGGVETCDTEACSGCAVLALNGRYVSVYRRATAAHHPVITSCVICCRRRASER